ncbi:polysaccharide pyruvyl transferase family protein [Aliishimia ponticola]|uniref:Polysaccharide pyruvyl transferase family protein n=1 Tax=Aliishimia ponticola TaxID=2499833 RepID=A0A4V3XK38_9RHOB|nr:polysaccharide pyruvyl transferase family protein [Aliishimia ponticola]THH35433.1 polysaccharide pyruvyl transferase family protein [Aliishimia ponticola]
MKIVIAAVMFSPNLGDGLIAECLTSLIREERPEAEVVWLDLAGRTEFVEPSGGLRTRVLGLLSWLPQSLSHPISAQLVQRQIQGRLAPNIPEALEGADLLIIGGGQLLGDANLNFPLKLAHVVAAAEARNIPVALHGVGVAAKWSDRGRSLFAKTLQSPNLKFISVRDDASAKSLARHYAALGPDPAQAIRVYPDPGLCTDRLKTSTTIGLLGGGPRIGVGIVHPAALATHSSGRPVLRRRDAFRAYKEMITALTSAGAQVQLFTNGAGEDEEFLDDFILRVGVLPSTDTIARFRTPLELADFMQNIDAVASYRLHACIAANAVGTKAVGFRWDKKIDAYFQMTGQPECLFNAPSDSPALVDALLSPISPVASKQLSRLKPKVRAGVRALLATG